MDRLRSVEYTWAFEVTEGVESVVLVTLEPRGEETEVSLRHSKSRRAYGEASG